MSGRHAINKLGSDFSGSHPEAGNVRLERDPDGKYVPPEMCHSG